MKRRIFSILLSGIMVFSLCSQPVHAEENRQSGGTTIECCEHHTEHTPECGYVAPTEGHECGHVHDESCGYQETGECNHVHDEECGYVEASEGSPCTYICKICEAQELMGQAGAEEPAVMSVSGFDFSLTGKPAGTVKTINLNAAALRPDSTWTKRTSRKQGDNLLYFGKYSGIPVAYRVLSSPNTLSTTSDCLLLDCDTTLEKMAFFLTGNLNQWDDSCIVRNWLNGTEFYENASVFTTLEKNAIAETKLHEQNIYSLYVEGNDPGAGEKYEDYSATDKVFCLSAAEADGLYSGFPGDYENSKERVKAGITGSQSGWWVRSTYAIGKEAVGYVSYGGGICHLEGADTAIDGVSPALNVNLSKVLFASASGLGPSRESLGKTSTLQAVGDGSSINSWKLTLLDSSKTVCVTSGQSVARSDAGGSTTITVPYTYTDRNTNNSVSRISFMITDKPYMDSNAQVLYYGALENTIITDGGASGIGTLTLPTELVDRCESDYYAYIIAEDVNGEQETDYASKPQQILKYTVTVTNGTLSSGNTTGDYIQGKTVTITADAAPDGQQFKEWEVVSGTITLASSTSKTTTFTMPAEAVSVKANYEAIPVPAPSITTQPGNVTVKKGKTATFTIVASGTDLTYQWMMNRNDGNGWGNIANANAASYTTSAVDKSYNGYQYKCVVSNSAGTVESSIATLTVQKAGSSKSGSGGSGNSGGSSGSTGTLGSPYITYQIMNGANSSWTYGSSEGLTIRGSGDFSKFIGIKVDGSLLDQSNYSAKEGSTIITLKPSYLNTLAAGSHTVQMLWTDGSANTAFTINATASGKKDDVPNTGDDAPIAGWFVLMGISGMGMIVAGKKGKKNPETLRK